MSSTAIEPADTLKNGTGNSASFSSTLASNWACGQFTLGYGMGKGEEILSVTRLDARNRNE
jgi:hypothetical protein